MGTEFRWSVEAEATLLSTELNNLADTVLGVDTADYDNAANKYRWADFLFQAIFDAACDAGALVELHVFYRLDGTVYGDGEDGDIAAPVASGNSLHGIFNIGADAGPIFQQCLRVPLSPFKFRGAVRPLTGQDLTPVDTHYLKIYPYNEDQP